MRKILLTPRAFDTFGSEILHKMRNSSYEFIINDTGKQLSNEKFIELASDVDGIIVSVDIIDRALIERCHNLKAIVKFGVGLDNIDLKAAEEHGIAVSKTEGTNALSVAELTVGMMLASARYIVSSALNIKKGTWNKPTGIELQGKIVGIIGFGTIGKNVAKLLSSFGMKIVVYDIYDINRNDLAQYNCQQVDFDTIISNSDFLTIHIPLTEKTKGMISAKEINQMKQSAILINMSRGGIVDENDLLNALQTKRIQAAASDVLSNEPPKMENEKTLISLDNFILTPHIGSRTVDSEVNTIKKSLSIIDELLNKAGK